MDYVIRFPLCTFVKKSTLAIRGSGPSHLISAFFATAPEEEEGSADRPRFIPFPLQRKFQNVTGLPYHEKGEIEFGGGNRTQKE